MMVALALTGCAGAVDTRSEVVPPLVVPPDLSQPPSDEDLSKPITGASGGMTPPLARTPNAAPPVMLSPLPSASRAQIQAGPGYPVLLLSDDMDDAWRRTGIVLEHVGLQIQDRDRSNGVYRVRYNDTAKRGFWARMVAKRNVSAEAYRVALTSAASGTELRLLDGNGAELPAGVALQWLQRLLPELR